tara:strand:+ start:940 stop:1248 length:309 start_codon:yes stop_codon:yes gene_type:complete
MIYTTEQTRKYKVGNMTMIINYNDTTDEYYKKLKVLKAVMDNYKNNQVYQSFTHTQELNQDIAKVKEMQTLLEISTDNFDKGSRGKKHKRLMNELYEKYNVK